MGITLGAFLSLLAVVLQGKGTQMCPATTSAVVNTSTSFLCSYLMQILLFHTAASLMKIAGALLMFMGVCSVVLARHVEQNRAKAQSPGNLSTESTASDGKLLEKPAR